MVFLAAVTLTEAACSLCSTIGGRSASLDVGSANSASWGSTFRGFAPLQFVRGAKAAAEAPEKVRVAPAVCKRSLLAFFTRHLTSVLHNQQGKGGSGKAEGGTASLIVKHSIKDVTPADAGRFVVFPESVRRKKAHQTLDDGKCPPVHNALPFPLLRRLADPGSTASVTRPSPGRRQVAAGGLPGAREGV